MILGINQPYYLPYIGMFERISYCDLFVINSLSKINREKSKHRRVKIIQVHPEATSSAIYLTQYVEKRYDRFSFCDIPLGEEFWSRQEIHARHIKHTYNRSKHFSYIRDLLPLLTDRSFTNLGEFNYNLILYLASKFEIKTKIINLSDSTLLRDSDNANFSTHANVENYKICNHYEASRMIIGHNGHKWIDLAWYASRGISIDQQKKEFIPYPQFSRSSDFVPGLSVIDILANCGREAKYYLGKNSEVVNLVNSIKD